MKTEFIFRSMAALALGTALLAAGYFIGSRPPMLAATDDKAPASADRKVLYWHDPMMPGQHFDKPGKSPFMDMALQPVYADEHATSGISVDGGLQQSLGIRYATVRREDVAQAFDEIGTTQLDESATDVVQARTTGYIEQLQANAPLQRITQGAPIASLFVPEWIGPQAEYLALRHGGADAALRAAARARLLALSMPASMVLALERSGAVQTHLTLSAPRTGVMTELNVRNGAMVAPGQTIAKVASLTNLWLVIDVPESQALRMQPGMPVDATFAGDPSTHFSGRIREILPGIQTDSRTLQARLTIANPDLKLTPGMLMRVRVQSLARASRLMVPSEAIITTGKRSIVIARDEDGRLRPVVITPGIDIGDETEIVSGLAEGQQVVASGQFLIDSEANLKAVLPKLEHNPSAAATPPEDTNQGVAQ